MNQPFWGRFAELTELVCSCCRCASADLLQEFREAWLAYLQFDLSRFVADGNLIERVSDAAWQEYERKFSSVYDPDFDYGLYFRAIAYAHLSHFMEDRGVEKLLTGIPPRGAFATVDHGCCLVLYFVLLRANQNCRRYLLHLSFGLTSREMDTRGCLETLRKTLEEQGLLA